MSQVIWIMYQLGVTPPSRPKNYIIRKAEILVNQLGKYLSSIFSV
jgi:hypothetical protein